MIHPRHASGEVEPLRCPECGGSGMWRRGIFNHEKICRKCDVRWCPVGVVYYRRQVADSLVGQDGDGI